MKIPITQSEEWQRLQEDLGEQTHFIKEKTYQYLAIEKHTPIGKYLYCPYGPIATSKESFQSAIESLESLGRELGAIFIRVEPFEADQSKCLPQKAKKSIDLNPKETWLLDLSGSEEELKQKLPSRLLRYHKAASKKGITIEQSHDPADIHYLLDLQRALAKEKGISTFSEHYLQTELKQPFATLYLVWYDQTRTVTNGNTWEGDRPEANGDTDGWPSLGAPHGAQRHGGKCEDRTRQEIIAAGLVFDDETTRYNLQGAQSDEGRKLHATGILTIQLILDAAAKGLKIFDFWGIAPEGAPDTHPWAGFTNFKKTFAGYQYDHAGTYDLILAPSKYKLYQATRRLARRLH